MQKIACNDDFRQLGRVEITFDVVQRDGAEKSAVISHIKIVESRSDKLFADLGETGRGRNGQRVWLH